MGPLGVQLPKKDVLQHPHQVEHGNGNSKNSNHRLYGVYIPTSNNHHQLPDEIHRSWNAERGCHSDNKGPCQEGHFLSKPPIVGNMPCMGLIVHKTCDGKEHSRGQGMGKHIKNRPGHADHIESSHSQKDIPHVATAGIADHILGVLLEKGHQAPVDNTKDA